MSSNALWLSIASSGAEIGIIILVFAFLYDRLSKRLKTLSKKMDKLETSFEEFTKEFKDDNFLKKLAEKVANIINNDYALVSKTESPVSLTEIGKEINDSIDAERIASNYIKYYKKEHSGWQDMNAYHTQETCFEFCSKKLISLLSEQEKKPLEDEAYQRGIDISNIFRVIGIVMRDKMLKEKGIDKKEVDKHDPHF